MAPRLRKLTLGPIADRIRELAITHPDWSPPQVHAEIEREFGRADETEGVPSLRTVQRFLYEFNRPDDSGPWSLAESPGDVAALVLPAVRWALEHDQPRITQALAIWIERIRRVAGPNLDVESVYLLAQHARRGGGDVERVEQYLSFEPWTEAGAAALAGAHERGLLDFGITFMAGGIEPRRKDGQNG